MKTVRDVIKHCEGRTGTKMVGGLFVPFGGGGLYGLEQLALESDAVPKSSYTRQRVELEYLMINLHRALNGQPTI